MLEASPVYLIRMSSPDGLDLDALLLEGRKQRDVFRKKASVRRKSLAYIFLRSNIAVRSNMFVHMLLRSSSVAGDHADEGFLL